MSDHPLLFDQRFLDRYAGSIISDPAIALLELVANAWDAFATKVEIRWPSELARHHFSILDNGTGMTSADFEQRWGTLDYNRATRQGEMVPPPPELSHLAPRHAYGRNGRGRHAAFHFGSEYKVRTWRDTEENLYRVYRADLKPFDWEQLRTRTWVEGHGTEISSLSIHDVSISAGSAREILGTRFLFDPHFSVWVNGAQVSFERHPGRPPSTVTHGSARNRFADILMLDAARLCSSRQHGIAWHVRNRLVGTCSWSGSIRTPARLPNHRNSPHTFIEKADFLRSSGATGLDWL